VFKCICSVRKHGGRAVLARHSWCEFTYSSWFNSPGNAHVLIFLELYYVWNVSSFNFSPYYPVHYFMLIFFQCGITLGGHKHSRPCKQISPPCYNLTALNKTRQHFPGFITMCESLTYYSLKKCIRVEIVCKFLAGTFTYLSSARLLLIF